MSCAVLLLPTTNRIVKLVRAIRKGWLKVGKRRQRPQEQPMYLLWGDDDQVGGQGLKKPQNHRFCLYQASIGFHQNPTKAVE